MKKKISFVTNSSSSNFILIGEKVKFEDINLLDNSGNRYFFIDTDDSDSINELDIDYLNNDSDNIKDYIFYKSHFYKQWEGNLNIESLRDFSKLDIKDNLEILFGIVRCY